MARAKSAPRLTPRLSKALVITAPRHSFDDDLPIRFHARVSSSMRTETNSRRSMPSRAGVEAT